MRYPILLLVILFAFVFTSANALPPEPLTNFTITVLDDSNNSVSTPIFLNIEEMYNGQVYSAYKIDLLTNPQTISIDWYVPSREVNSEINISAGKNGFENSDTFIFTITEQTPTSGSLFEHTFQLKREGTSKSNLQNFDVLAFEKNFNISTKSTSQIQSMNFIDSENSLVVILNENAIKGFLEITLPKSLLNSPFNVNVGDVTIFPVIDEKSSSSTIFLEYTNGLHSIRISSPLTIDGEKRDFLPESDQDETQPIQQTGDGGGCLIATATFGSELAPQVQQLRELRDNKLLNTESGTSFMNTFNEFYYSFSPIIADYERENLVFKEMVKLAITPMISSLSILNYVDMDSEAQVLGYGISLILLNVGMYVGIPASVIIGIRKKF